MTFDPKLAANNLLVLGAERGETIEPDIVSMIIECREPRDEDNYLEGRRLELTRLNRLTLLREELLDRRVLALPTRGGGLELITRADQVARALTEMRKDVDKSLRSASRRIASLEVGDLANSLIAQQHDALAYVDALRRALNPASRRLRPRLRVVNEAEPSAAHLSVAERSQA